MKRVAIALLAGVAVVAGHGFSASAADLGVQAAAVPAAAVVPVWTGLYIGVNGGPAGQHSSEWTFDDPNNGIHKGLGGSSASLGGVAGLQAGYNWQFAPAWVIGIESDFDWASLGDHRTIRPDSQIGSSVSMSQNTEWLSSVRGRFGWIPSWFGSWWNNTMFYATGGGALAHMEYSAQTVASVGTGSQNAVSNTSFQATKTGYVVGGGVQWMATPNILLGAEYLFYGINGAANGSAGVFPTPVAGAFPLPFNYGWARDQVQVVRVTGSYKF